jgi:hypothetical protein
MYKLGQVVKFDIQLDYPDMERAILAARQRALIRFGVDDDGHIRRVEGAERSNSTIEIKFLGLDIYGGMMGWNYIYKFKARVVKHDDE